MLIICVKTVNGQVIKSDSLQISPLLINTAFEEIQGRQFLSSFKQELNKYQAQKKKQLTIIHIGDSHVQGYYFAKAIRDSLQTEWGNAGRGLVFPYRVAETNGAFDVFFKATGDWSGIRNVKADDSTSIGISGIHLSSKDSDFVLQVTLDPEDSVKASRVRILSPHPERFKLSLSAKKDLLKSVNSIKAYTVRSGDYLGKIARKFGISVSAIRKANNLRNDRIYAGKTLSIPTKEKHTEILSTAEFTDLEPTPETGIFHLPDSVEQFFVRPASEAAKYELDGLLLESDDRGVVYHAIGVNGAKVSDYNRYPRFFDQLAALEPDLIILSMGTNESFYEPYSADEFYDDLKTFYKLLLDREVDASILATSPPPSLKKRRYPNDLATAYSYELMMFANLNQWAFFDLHNLMGASENIKEWRKAGLASPDMIHYFPTGYKIQGRLVAAAILNALKE